MKSCKLISTAFLLGFAICIHSGSTHSQPVLSIELEIPALKVNPYHRPYVAVWLETTDRKAIATLAVWHEKDTWLKDLRQWWRKVGRAGVEKIDAVTGATRKPGRYTIHWDGKDAGGNVVPSGDYLLNIEAAREEGDRSYLRRKITLGAQATLSLPAENEINVPGIAIHSLTEK